ncbi:hypothetical protein BJ742DRAFT_872203 [Cladochytrium replicatum]|nr:hypothetical protein BJ742DRAFT_872203 [Cladochytrium replicatum]
MEGLLQPATRSSGTRRRLHETYGRLPPLENAPHGFGHLSPPTRPSGHRNELPHPDLLSHDNVRSVKRKIMVNKGQNIESRAHGRRIAQQSIPIQTIAPLIDIGSADKIAEQAGPKILVEVVPDERINRRNAVSARPVAPSQLAVRVDSHEPENFTSLRPSPAGFERPSGVRSRPRQKSVQRFISSNNVGLKQMEHAAKTVRAKRNWTKALAKVQRANNATSIFRRSFQKSRARARWYFAITTVLKLLKATSLFVRHEEGDMTAGSSSAGESSLFMSSASKTLGADSRGLTWALRIIDCKASVILASKVQSLLSQRAQDRSLPDTDMDELDRILCRLLSYYAKFNKRQRHMFCRAANFECFGAGTLVIREGDRPTFFYFLLSGQCEEYHSTSAGAKIVTSLMDAGSCFGHIEGENHLRRASSISCTLETEVLRIDAEDFLDILRANEDEINETKLQMLMNHPAFADTGQVTLQKVCQSSEIMDFDPHSVIVQEGVPCPHIYLLISGSCRAVKVVPFKITKDKHTKQTLVVPYDEKNKPQSHTAPLSVPQRQSVLGGTPEGPPEESHPPKLNSDAHSSDSHTSDTPTDDHVSLEQTSSDQKTSEEQSHPQHSGMQGHEQHRLKSVTVVNELLSIYDLSAGAIFPDLLSPSSRLLRRHGGSTSVPLSSPPNAQLPHAAAPPLSVSNTPILGKMNFIDELTAAAISLGPYARHLMGNGTPSPWRTHNGQVIPTLPTQLLFAQPRDSSDVEGAPISNDILSTSLASPFHDNALTPPFSVIACTKVECLRMSKVDFVRLASPEAVRLALLTVGVPIDNLKDSYLQRNGWDLFKRNVVYDVLEHGRRRDIVLKERKTPLSIVGLGQLLREAFHITPAPSPHQRRAPNQTKNPARNRRKADMGSDKQKNASPGIGVAL